MNPLLNPVFGSGHQKKESLIPSLFSQQHFAFSSCKISFHLQEPLFFALVSAHNFSSWSVYVPHVWNHCFSWMTHWAMFWGNLIDGSSSIQLVHPTLSFSDPKMTSESCFSSHCSSIACLKYFTFCFFWSCFCSFSGRTSSSNRSSLCVTLASASDSCVQITLSPEWLTEWCFEEIWFMWVRQLTWSTQHFGFLAKWWRQRGKAGDHVQ